jgi:nitrate/nitrite transport system ATP-binding protein
MTLPAQRKSLPPLVWPLTLSQEPVLQPRAVASSPIGPVLELCGVGKHYGSGSRQTRVLNDINLAVAPGEFVAIVGYSGSGKTTLISLMAGLIAPTSGRILKDGKALTGPGPDRGVVFQSYSLMPWLTVTKNVALAVDQVFAKHSSRERAERIAHYIELVNLTPAKDKLPAELSGGMRQRVAVARALAADPDVLLLDEPLSALDALTRAKLQDELERIWSHEKKTVVLITNDVDEGLLLADRIIPLTPGPNATLGPEFVIDLARPRERKASNHDPRFQALRKAVTGYLLEAGRRAPQPLGEPSAEYRLPTMRPNTAREMQPIGTTHRNTSTDSQPRYVDFSQVSKIYPSQQGPATVVDRFDLQINKGEFVSIIGHSGCGKSTVLSMVAGLNPLSAGGIVLDFQEVTAAGPDRGIVFQAPSLVPWMTAFENVMLGVAQVYPHASAAEQQQFATYYLTRVGLCEALHKRPGELSKGMQQRVGIARAFALQPKLLLLDEPFGMLDSLTRWELQEVLMEVWSRNQLTAICVTHDIDEALLLSDRVVMMTNGPNARVGGILNVDLPRPRSRRALLDHPDYYRLREELLEFLISCDHP